MELNDYDDTILSSEWKQNLDQEAIQTAILQIPGGFW